MGFSNRIAKTIFVISALVLLALAIVLYLQIHDLIQSFNRVSYTHVVKLKLEQTLSYLKDAETAQRGYLLTKDSIFLSPYTGAYEKTKLLLKELETITKENEQQQQNLTVLMTLINVRFNTFNHVITEYNKPNQNEVSRKLFLLRGKESMDAIRQRVQNMMHIEDQLMGKRETLRDRKSFLTPLFAFFLILASLIVLVFSYTRIIKELNKSKRYLANLKTLNDELQSKNKALELYNKELDSFSYIASHDLKEPLRKIQLYSAMLEEESTHLSEKGTTSLQRITASAERMQNLLKDLLHYSFYTNNERGDFVSVSLDHIVQEAERSLKETIDESQAVITVENLPSVNGMPFQLKQLFENLISNSIKFKKAAFPPTISITASLIRKENIQKSIPALLPLYHKIIYRDNGIGFEQHFGQKVFMLFQRLHTKDAYEGTGMGLTICKKIVQNHNGFIEAYSRPNNGVTFEIYLPA